LQWFLKSNLAIGIALLILILFSLAILRPGSPAFVVAVLALIIVIAFLALVIVVTRKILSRMAREEHEHPYQEY